MATFNKFNQTVEDLAHKIHDLGSDTLKVALSNTAPAAANSVFADITEITGGNGYTAGGQALTITSSGQSSGTYSLIVEDEVFTASGGSMGPFRYVILYNDTPTSPADPLLGWYDNGSEVTLADGEKFTVDADQVNGILQLS